jgi:P-type Cu2+ transporter
MLGLILQQDSGCAHCGLALPPGVTTNAQQPAFCCEGCRSVFELIGAYDLGAYYRERERAGQLGRPAKIHGGSYAELDDPEFLQSRCRLLLDGSRAIELYLEGVHCSACVWLVESLPRALAGVVDSRLDLGRSLARVTFRPEQVSLSQVARTLDGLGYPPHPAADERARADIARDRALLLRIGVAGFSAGNVMLMAFALYGGAFAGMEAEFVSLFRWGSFALSLPAVLFCASVFYRGALASLRTRTPHMDLPIAIGIWTGFFWGALNTLRGGGEIYFDSLTTLIFLLLVGRYLQQQHHRRASSAAELAQALSPAVARVRDEQGTHEAQAARVARGVLVEVRAGERIPVDGRIEEGRSSIDASLLSGESNPEEVAIGDRVFAGTTNVGETILVWTEHSGAETRVGKLVDSIEAAQRERAPLVKLADRVAGKFVLVVLALAALTLLAWWGAGPDRAIEHAVALLVVTCPCALGMATPLAVSVALRRAASAGLLFKGGEPLEALARPGTIVFDKTGTLTEGRPRLVRYRGPRGLLELAAALERGSEHPLAKAIRRAATAPSALEVTRVEMLTGSGVRGQVGEDRICVGSPALFRELGLTVSAALQDELRAGAEAGLTCVLIGRNDQVEGVAGFGDALRSDARTTLEALREAGYELMVLSGDDPRAVRRVCRDLPLVECRGGVNPEQKLARVRELTQAGRCVLMVGDGVNDAAAMSAATVGFAVHGGAEASLLAAHVFSTRPGIAPVLAAIRGARRTLRVIRRGIAFSLAYNALGVGLALAGVLSPLVAAVLMPLSSLTVVSSALRSRAFKEER